MPITRTPIINDDGSLTVGTVFENAWKTELYNQIDAVVAAGAPTYAAFTPNDASGAGLAFSLATGYSARIGRLVYVGLQVIYPVTANGAAAKIGGLPFVISNGLLALYQGYGAPGCRGFGANGATLADLYAVATGAVLTNANMSSANITLHGVYLTT